MLSGETDDFKQESWRSFLFYLSFESRRTDAESWDQCSVYTWLAICLLKEPLNSRYIFQKTLDRPMPDPFPNANVAESLAL